MYSDYSLQIVKQRFGELTDRELVCRRIVLALTK